MGFWDQYNYWLMFLQDWSQVATGTSTPTRTNFWDQYNLPEHPYLLGFSVFGWLGGSLFVKVPFFIKKSTNLGRNSTCLEDSGIYVSIYFLLFSQRNTHDIWGLELAH